MKSFFRNQKGVTYTEIIIYIGIIAVIVVGIVSIIVQLVELKLRSDSIALMVSETSNIFDKMLIDVRDCDSFSVLDSTTLQLSKDGATSLYYSQNSNVYFNDGENDFQLTSNLVNVADFSIVDWTSINSDNLIHIGLTLERGGISEDFQTSVHKR